MARDNSFREGGGGGGVGDPFSDNKSLVVT